MMKETENLKGELVWEENNNYSTIEKIITLHDNDRFCAIHKDYTISFWYKNEIENIVELKSNIEKSLSINNLAKEGNIHRFKDATLVNDLNNNFFLVLEISISFCDSKQSAYGWQIASLIINLNLASKKVIKIEKVSPFNSSLFYDMNNNLLIGNTFPNNRIVFLDFPQLTVNKQTEIKGNYRTFVDSDFSLLITNPDVNKIEIWNYNHLKKLSEITLHKNGYSNDLCYCKSNKVIASNSSQEKMIRIFDISSGINIKSIELPNSSSCRKMTFSTCGNYFLLIMRHDILIFSAKNYEFVTKLIHPNKNKDTPANDGYINPKTIDMSHDDKFIYTYTSDGVIRKWK